MDLKEAQSLKKGDPVFYIDFDGKEVEGRFSSLTGIQLWAYWKRPTLPSWSKLAQWMPIDRVSQSKKEPEFYVRIFGEKGNYRAGLVANSLEEAKTITNMQQTNFRIAKLEFLPLEPVPVEDDWV